MPHVRIADLTKRYGSIVALNRVSLEVRDREYLSIIGPSGCGKTTLIKCIAGIIHPDEGEISVDGRNVDRLPIQDRELGYVFQEIALFPHMNARENISYGPTVKGWASDKTGSIVTELLNMIKLSDRGNAFPDELSGGAQQKTAVSRALASGSSLLLLDEPLGALDAKVRAELRYELRRFVKDLHLTAVHVTHDQEEAMSISDRVVVMRAGRIVEVGTPMELYLKPKEIFTANFVGEANFMDVEIAEKTEEGCILNVGGLKLRVRSKAIPGVERVVAAVRPEFISIRNHRVHGVDDWLGEIEGESFTGTVTRYDVRVTNGEKLVVKHPISAEEPEFHMGDKVNLSLPADHILVYPYPEAGLEKETSVE